MGKARQQLYAIFPKSWGKQLSKARWELVKIQVYITMSCAAWGRNLSMPIKSVLTRQSPLPFHMQSQILRPMARGKYGLFPKLYIWSMEGRYLLLLSFWVWFRDINISLWGKKPPLALWERSAELGVCLVLCSPASTVQEGAFQWGQLFGEVLNCTVAVVWPFEPSLWSWSKNYWN